MASPQKDIPALIIIDMVKDNFAPEHQLPITPLAQKIIAPINRLSAFFRKNNFPVVFSTDAFNQDDFIFSGRMRPHSIAGTPGAEVVDSLVRQDHDYWLPKPRFSAFFKTGLEQWLQQRNVTICAVTGIATNFCVLTTVMDALCHNFKAILIEDCAAAASEHIHKQTIEIYQRNPLYPLFQILKSNEFMREMDA
jgi:nicotinamidase-related amidase